MCEDWPILQISYGQAQRETQGAPQTHPLLFFWGRPIKVSLFKKLSSKWTCLCWIWVCWTWDKPFAHFRCECSKKRNHFKFLKTRLVYLRKVGSRELRHTGSCLPFLTARRCTLEKQVTSENESGGKPQESVEVIRDKPELSFGTLIFQKVAPLAAFCYRMQYHCDPSLTPFRRHSIELPETFH